MKKLKLFVWLLLFSMVFLTAFAQGTTSEAERKKILDSYHAEEGEILFYGKVVDQFTNPVVGASVEVSVPVVKTWGPMSSARRILFTDEGGNFEVSAKTYGVSKLVGQYLDVERIVRKGYAGDWVRGTNRSFPFSTDNTQRFRADASKPVVYQLRKTGMPAFLFHETDLSLELRTAASGWTLGYDFISHHRLDNIKRLVFDYQPVFPDLKLKATFNTNAATWTVIMSAGSTNGGIIALDQLLYEAPETGYQSEYVFTPEDHPKPVRLPHIYLKSRDPAIYTRIDIKYINANKEFFRLSGESVTNPYGDRNLEQATDLPWAVTKQLTDEVKAAFRADKRPLPPDLPKLVKEAKTKRN